MTLTEARTLLSHSSGNASHALDQYAEHVQEEIAKLARPYEAGRGDWICAKFADELSELRERLGGEAPEEQADG